MIQQNMWTNQKHSYKLVKIINSAAANMLKDQ